MTLLQLQDVTYRYKNTAEAVLYQINYNFEPGKFYSIIGESGAGNPHSCPYLLVQIVLSKVLSFSKEKTFGIKGYSYHRMHHISLVFQNYNLIDYLSPLENIRLVNKKSKQDTLLELGWMKVRSSGMFSSYQGGNSNVLQLLVVWYRKLQLFQLMSQQEIWTLKLLEILSNCSNHLPRKQVNVSLS